MGWIIVFSLISISTITYFIYKINNEIKYYKQKIETIHNKIIYIYNSMISEIDSHKDTIYYPNMLKKYINLEILVKKPKQYNQASLDEIYQNYQRLDSIYVNFKRDLRTLDKYDFIKNNINSYKSKYRYLNNKRQKIYIELKQEYKDLDEFLKYDIDFTFIQKTEINKIDELYKQSYNLYKDYNIHELKKNVTLFDSKHDNLIYILTEIERIKEKLEETEMCINKLENDISKKKDSLYMKCFSKIRNEKVDKDVVENWNEIQNLINDYNKKKVLKENIFILHEKIHFIVNQMKNLKLYFEAVT
jgi:hypothetical protein